MNVEKYDKIYPGGHDLLCMAPSDRRLAAADISHIGGRSMGCIPAGAGVLG